MIAAASVLLLVLSAWYAGRRADRRGRARAAIVLLRAQGCDDLQVLRKMTRQGFSLREIVRAERDAK